MATEAEVVSRGALEVAETDGASGPPASLLLIVGEPFTVDQKDLILERIVSELSAWDSERAKCDVNEQLRVFAQLQPKVQDGPNGEKIFSLESDQLKVTVLLNARVQTVREQICHFFLSHSVYFHLLYSGLALHGSGCWILQDGTFGFSSLSELLGQANVAEAVRRTPGATLCVSVLPEGAEWKEENLKRLVPHLTVHLNPPKNQKNEDGVTQFVDVLSASLKAPSSVDLLPATDIVGSISFQRPTMYVFPAGSGDSAFFGVSGFNLLVNGGYSRRSCFWPLVRHLVRIDAVFVSHIGPENAFGISSFLERKAFERTSPDLGMVYLNIGETKPVAPNGALAVPSGLLLNLADEGASIVDHLRQVEMSVNPLVGSLTGQTLQSVNLYFKVGHGSLDLFVLNPLNGKEFKDFLSNWTKNINSAKNSSSADQSICCLLVWKPACPDEKTVRILFPGGAPQSKIFEGIERLKSVALFQSADGVTEKVVAKVSDKKPPSATGKPSSGQQAAPPVAVADHKKPPGVALEHKASAVEHKDSKKSVEHRETKRPADKNASGKVELESKGKPENKEQKTLEKLVPSAKRSEGKHVAEQKDGKAPGKLETVVKKTELKADHKETKSLAKHELETKKGEGNQTTEPKESKKTSAAKPKDLKRVSAVTHAAVVESKESKSPAAKQEPPSSKVSSKVTEKAAKDAKNKNVVKETQEMKTPTKKGATSKESPTTTKSAGKEKKKEVATVEGKGHVTRNIVPSVEVAKISPELGSVEVEKNSKEEQQVKDETKDPGTVLGAELNTSESPFAPGVEVTQLSESFSASTEKYEIDDRQEETEHLILSHEVKTKNEDELQGEADHPEPNKTGLDEIVSGLPVTEEPATFALESAASEEEISNQLASSLEESASKLVAESFPTLDQSAPVEMTEPRVDQPVAEEALRVSELELGQGVRDEEIVEESKPLVDPPATGDVIESPAALVDQTTAKEVLEKSEPLLDHSVSGKEEVEALEPLVGYPVADEEVVEQSEPVIDHPSAKEVETASEPEEEFVERPESEPDDPVQDDEIIDEALVLDHPSPGEEISKKLTQTFSVGHQHGPDFRESSEVTEDIQSVGIKPGDLIENQSGAAIEEPFEIPDVVDDILVSPDEQTTDSQCSLIEKDLLERLEKEEMEKGDGGPVDKHDTELVESQLLDEEELEEDIPVKALPAEGQFSANEETLLEPPETEECQDPGKPLPEAGDGREKEVKKDVGLEKDGQWVPMEAGGELSVVEEHIEYSNEEEDIAGDEESPGDVNASGSDQVPFDPLVNWGQPEGLPAPLNGKKDGSAKKGNQSVLQAPPSGIKKPGAQNAPGKKTEGPSSAKQPPAAVENPPTRAEKVGDEAAKPSVSRSGTSAGGQKKGQPPVRSADSSIRESSAKASHAPDIRKTLSKPVVPFYVDLAYIPCHGDTRRFDADFFRSVRARYYVLSSPDPDPRALSLLLDAKESWTTPASETTIIPTYDSDRLTAWVAENQERLNGLKVIVAVSADRHTMQLQEHETSCHAYRLEF